MITAREVVYVALGVLLLIAVGFRRRSLTESGSARPLTVALLFLSLFCFLATIPVKAAVIDVFNHGLAAAVLKNAAVWGVSISVLWLSSVVRHPERTSRGRGFWGRIGLIALGTAVMLSPLFTADASLGPDGVQAGVYEAEWGGWLYWLLNAAAPTWGCFEAARLTIGNARRATAALRTGLRLIALGTSVGVALLALRTVQMIRLAAGGTLLPFYQVAITATVAICVALIGLGSCYQALAPWAQRVSANRRYRRQFLALQPLWLGLHNPGAAVATFTPEARELFTAPRLLLVRRVIEIRDGILGLGPFMSEDVHADAQRMLRTLPPQAATDPAAETAARLASAQRVAHLEPRPAVTSDEVESADPNAGGEGSMASEIRWLIDITRWYARLPVAAQENAS